MGNLISNLKNPTHLNYLIECRPKFDTTSKRCSIVQVRANIFKNPQNPIKFKRIYWFHLNFTTRILIEFSISTRLSSSRSRYVNQFKFVVEEALWNIENLIKIIEEWLTIEFAYLNINEEVYTHSVYVIGSDLLPACENMGNLISNLKNSKHLNYLIECHQEFDTNRCSILL